MGPYSLTHLLKPNSRFVYGTVRHEGSPGYLSFVEIYLNIIKNRNWNFLPKEITEGYVERLSACVSSTAQKIYIVDVGIFRCYCSIDCFILSTVNSIT
jgi:hypothetical protein